MPHCKMKIRQLILLFFINGNLLLAQNEKGIEPRPNLLIKADLRSLKLQPKLSFEYFFKEKLSWELGASYFWSGQQIHFEDFYQQGMGYAFFGVGPSKGQDIFSDLKYSTQTGFYLGIGYLYRYSHFVDKHYEADVGNKAYQYYNQSETAYSNFVRFTLGSHRKLKNKNIYVNPYASIMIGNTNLKLKIDTLGGEPLYYSRDVMPINENKKIIKCILLIGFNFCFDFFPTARKPD